MTQPQNRGCPKWFLPMAIMAFQNRMGMHYRKNVWWYPYLHTIMIINIYIILYYIILYYTILYYITLYYIILYYIILYIYTVRERNSHLYRIDGGLSPSPFVSPNGRRRRRPSRTSSPRSNAPTGGSGASSASGNLGSSTPLSLTTRNEGPGAVGGEDGEKKKLVGVCNRSTGLVRSHFNPMKTNEPGGGSWLSSMRMFRNKAHKSAVWTGRGRRSRPRTTAKPLKNGSQHPPISSLNLNPISSSFNGQTNEESGWRMLKVFLEYAINPHWKNVHDSWNQSPIKSPQLRKESAPPAQWWHAACGPSPTLTAGGALWRDAAVPAIFGVNWAPADELYSCDICSFQKNYTKDIGRRTK